MAESRGHAGDGGAFARFAGEHAEQEDAEQRAHGNGADGQAGLEDGFRMARRDRDGEQHAAPGDGGQAGDLQRAASVTDLARAR